MYLIEQGSCNYVEVKWGEAGNTAADAGKIGGGCERCRIFNGEYGASGADL